MKISICIPTFKRPDRVIEALNSCLNQTFLPFEILIGDDSPDDLTQKVIKRAQEKSGVALRYFHNIPSLGQVENVNLLFDNAQGDKILLLHDDDLLLENCLKTLVNCFNHNSSIDVAYGKQYIINDSGKLKENDSTEFNRVFFRTGEYEGSVLTSLEAGLVQQFPNNAFLMRSNVAKTLKYENVGPQCDFDFGLRAGKRDYIFYFVNEYTAKYRLSNIAVSKSQHLAALNAYIMVENTEVPQSSMKYKNFWMGKRAVIAAREALLNNKIDKALKIYFSVHHFKNIFTMGGIKNTVFLILKSPQIVKLIFQRNNLIFL